MIARTPIDLADAWLDASLAGRPVPPLVVVIGLGEGHLLEALDRRGSSTRVLAFEPDPAHAGAFLARRDWTSWRATGRLGYFVDPDYAGADEAWRMFPANPDEHLLLVDPAVARGGGERAVRAARLFKRILFGARANADARRQFAPRYVTNALRNGAAIATGGDLRGLIDAYRGVPAVIAAAGPSLDDALPGLTAVSGRGVLIAVDTALRPLLDYGLAPALVVGMDPSVKNGRHFRALPACPETWLVAETALDPLAARVFGDRTLWFRVADHHPWPWFRGLGIDTGQIDVWGSVLTAAFQVAVLAGCDPIVLVGADLAYTGGRPYARGTTYEFDWGYSAAIGADLGLAWRMQRTMFDLLEVPDLHGAPTTTTPPLQAFRDWMLTQASRCGRRVVNATGGGILFGDGVEVTTLETALHGAAPRVIPPVRDVARRATTARPRAALAAAFRDVRRLVDDRTREPIAEWAAFSGGGYDAVEVGHALDAAVTAFEVSEADLTAPGEPPRDTRHVPTAPPRLGGSILRSVPEAIARLRAALSDVQPLPPLVGAPSVDGEWSALSAALDLLGPLHSAVAAFVEDPVAPLPRQAMGRAPVSGAAAWPDEIAWPLQRFEALLGAAWPTSSPLEETFFTRDVVLRDPAATSAPASADSTAARPEAARPPDTAFACARLVLEWLLCETRRADAAASARVARVLRAVEASAAQSEACALSAAPAVMRLCASPVARARIPVPPELPLDERVLARALTGTLTWRGADGAVARQLTTPRVLTDEGLPRANLAYCVPGGAVCVSPHQSESLLVREDGCARRHHSWPRPIIGELPYGLHGALAWNHGGDKALGYVMYRSSPDGPVRIETVPFNPTFGAWWRGRVYWTCFPTGLGTWMPGEATLALDHLSLRAIVPDGAGLVLEPITRGAYQAPVRCVPPHAWRWAPGREPRPERVDTLGLGACRSSGEGWTAVGHPEADLIVLTSATGRTVEMTCYFPLALAWLGKSLLVCTIGQELLLFDDLRSALPALEP